MTQATIIGLDIAKDVFQVHGVDGMGAIVVRKKLRRTEVCAFFKHLSPCLVGIEACGASHHWGRTLTELGHTVRLMPPSLVAPYVKSQKNDANDAEAICEAVQRPNMRFVPIKSREQQGVLATHGIRELLIRQSTMLVNACRGYLAEYGMVSARGRAGYSELARTLGQGGKKQLPASALSAVKILVAQVTALKREIKSLDHQIGRRHSS